MCACLIAPHLILLFQYIWGIYYVNPAHRVNKVFKSKKDKIFYKTYLVETWGKYFKNKTLELINVKKIFRTNNSLENYNRLFKNLNCMKPNVIFSTYVDNIKNELIYNIKI